MREMSALLQKQYASLPFLHMPFDFRQLEPLGVHRVSGSSIHVSICRYCVTTSRRGQLGASLPRAYRAAAWDGYGCLVCC
jgi:hypothetical protein